MRHTLHTHTRARTDNFISWKFTLQHRVFSVHTEMWFTHNGKSIGKDRNREWKKATSMFCFLVFVFFFFLRKVNGGQGCCYVWGRFQGPLPSKHAHAGPQCAISRPMIRLHLADMGCHTGAPPELLPAVGLNEPALACFLGEWQEAYYVFRECP